MIQIGFCDDDPSVLDELHELLGSYRAGELIEIRAHRIRLHGKLCG